MKQVEYIVVGQGLAGSAVAVQLMKRGRKILMIDDQTKNSSSRIAAGLFNPITGKKMVKTWKADELFPALHRYYRYVEQYTRSSFFHPTPLYRPFLSIEELNEWMANSVDPAYASYISKVHCISIHNGIRDPFGGIELLQCGYLDTTQYIRGVREWIMHSGELINAEFNPDHLNIHASGVTYQDFSATKIIFCQGIHNNPWFNWLPIRPLKGETISVASDFAERIIINRGVYVLPSDSNKLQRVGATYHFNDRVEAITPAARVELSDRLRELVNYPFEIKEQQWGWRPTTPDRRPLLGTHPEHKALVVFNGLGTKGVSLAPYFSEILIHWLENQVPLDKDVDIERYKSLYWKSP